MLSSIVSIVLGVLSGIAALFYAYWVSICYFEAKLDYQRKYFRLVSEYQKEVEVK